MSRRALPLHPVVERIAANLAAVDAIRVVKVSPEVLRASSETQGARREPVTKAGHPTAVGVSLIPEGYVEKLNAERVRIPWLGDRRLRIVLADEEVNNPGTRLASVLSPNYIWC